MKIFCAAAFRTRLCVKKHVGAVFKARSRPINPKVDLFNRPDTLNKCKIDAIGKSAMSYFFYACGNHYNFDCRAASESFRFDRSNRKPFILTRYKYVRLYRCRV